MTARPHGLVARLVLCCALIASIGSLLLVRSTPARADDIPADPAAHGYVALCGVDGRPMTGGNIHDKPFIWSAISSRPAPSEAQGAGEVATLYVYQLRPGTAPYDWNGDEITSTSPYSTPRHPATQATPADYALAFVTKDYPPMDHGLYQLRMYFGNRQNPAYPDKYAASFIRVTGNRWSVVQGGTLDCHAGKAVSPEVRILGKEAAGTPSVSAPFGGVNGTGVPTNANGAPIAGAASPGAGAPGPGRPSRAAQIINSASNSVGSSAGSTAGSSPAAAASGATPTSASTASDASRPAAASSTGGSKAWVVLVALAVIVAIGAGWMIRRRTAR